MIKTVARQICPPVIWTGLAKLKRHLSSNISHSPETSEYVIKLGFDPQHQELDMYWDPNFAKILETWGEGNAWDEIQYLMINCSGRVLDIACGTGKTIEIVSRFPQLDIYGCDISDFLIQKAIERGISPEKLIVCDATKTDYPDDYFDYSYSIGSLEHFTEDGIEGFVTECYRITKRVSFHQVPTSRTGEDEGWTKTIQSFYNNSVDWWLGKFHASYEAVYVLDSRWADPVSVGKWFVCIKD